MKNKDYSNNNIFGVISHSTSQSRASEIFNKLKMYPKKNVKKITPEERRELEVLKYFENIIYCNRECYDGD